jgi:hypothetical protein
VSRRFNTLVTFQEAVTTRTPAGQVIVDEYENVDDLVDLPARIVAAIEEKHEERFIETDDLYEIYVQGDQPIRPEMVALTEQGVFDVRRVANPTLNLPTLVTIVLAQQVAL